MCGGRGTRLDATREKPLVEVGGRPLVDRVIAAAGDADRVDRVVAVVSPHTPQTAGALTGTDEVGEPNESQALRVIDTNVTRAGTELTVIRTPGEGYVTDLTAALDWVGRPVVTLAADLPLLSGRLVDRLLGTADGSRPVDGSEATAGPTTTVGSRTFVVPQRLKRTLGVSADERPYEPAPSRESGSAERTSGSGADESTSGDSRRGDADTSEQVWLPTGVNVVADDTDTAVRSWDARLAVNVNYASDIAVAQRLLGASDNTSDSTERSDRGDN